MTFSMIEMGMDMEFNETLTKAGVEGLSHLQLDEFPSTGRGVRALKPFSIDEKVLEVPGNLLWTIDNAFADPFLGPVLNSMESQLSVEDILSIFLLFVKSREEGYGIRQSHVRILPQSYTSSIFFEDDELSVCEGSSLYNVTIQLKQQIRSDHSELVRRVVMEHPDLFPLEKFTLDEYTWALCTVWSRGMDFKLPEKQFRCIAPFADMFNHSPEAKTCHAYDPQTGNLQVFAGKSYMDGDQIFIYYGPVSNARLLRLYGFVIPDNPNDSYDLILTTHPDAPLYVKKVTLFELAKLKIDGTFQLTMVDPLPANVLRYLRIQRATILELTGLEKQHEISIAASRISARNEGEILAALVAAFQQILSGFRVSLEELETHLKDGVYAAGSNSWAAAHVSLGEQKILRAALARANELIALIACAFCRKIEEGNKKCGRCKKVVYCGVECQKKHYQEHKHQCRKM